MRTPDPFDLRVVVRSHGFYDLPPWRWDDERRVLARPLRLASGRIAQVEVTEGSSGLSVRAMAQGRLAGADGEEVRRAVRAALDLDEDLGPFRRLAEALEARRQAGRGPGLPDLSRQLARGAGRLLRSPTVWEDAVKTLLTTNCSWALTRAMVGRLCERLGEEGPGGARTFPGPGALARRPERFFREAIRVGYRAPALLRLARAVASGRLDLEALRGSALPTAELLARLRALDGFGPYAAEHLLRLLGRHDHLALDSWTRSELRRLRGTRRRPADRTVRRWYAPYGRWAGLAMWLEVTDPWFDDAGRGAGARPW